MSDQEQNKVHQFSIALDRDLVERIDEIARKEDVSRSHVIRRAVRLFLTTSPVDGTISTEATDEVVK